MAESQMVLTVRFLCADHKIASIFVSRRQPVVQFANLIFDFFGKSFYI